MSGAATFDGPSRCEFTNRLRGSCMLRMMGGRFALFSPLLSSSNISASCCLRPSIDSRTHRVNPAGSMSGSLLKAVRSMSLGVANSSTRQPSQQSRSSSLPPMRSADLDWALQQFPSPVRFEDAEVYRGFVIVS